MFSVRDLFTFAKTGAPPEAKPARDITPIIRPEGFGLADDGPDARRVATAADSPRCRHAPAAAASGLPGVALAKPGPDPSLAAFSEALAIAILQHARVC